MKPGNIALALLAFAAIALPPRAAAATDVTGGLKLGLNVSDLVGADASPGAGGSKSSAAGLAAGGYLIFPLNGVKFRLQAECLLTTKGAIYKGDVLGSHYESRLKLTYLEIPVLARFDLQSRSGAKPAILIGPAFGIKLRARSESHTIGYSSTHTDDHVNSVDPGAMIGLTADIPAGAGAIMLDARYTRSLTTIYESTGGKRPDVKNSVITITLGYRF